MTRLGNTLLLLFGLCLLLGQSNQAQANHLRFGFASILSPANTFIQYKGLNDYLAQRLGRPMTPVLQKDYEEMNRLIETNQVDLAMVCTGALLFLDPAKYRLLALPQVRGQVVYQSVFIRHVGVQAQSLADFKGKSFAFTDKLSNSGALYPKALLRQLGQSPDKFFGKLYLTGSHDKSITLVNEGIIDGAAVDSLVLQYMREKDPASLSQIEEFHRSASFPISPLVASGHLSEEDFKLVQGVLVQMHQDPQAASILQELKIDRFVLPSPDLYQRFRESYGKLYQTSP